MKPNREQFKYLAPQKTVKDKFPSDIEFPPDKNPSETNTDAIKNKHIFPTTAPTEKMESHNEKANTSYKDLDNEQIDRAHPNKSAGENSEEAYIGYMEALHRVQMKIMSLEEEGRLSDEEGDEMILSLEGVITGINKIRQKVDKFSNTADIKDLLKNARCGGGCASNIVENWEGVGKDLSEEDVNPGELKMGIKVEMEHTTDTEISKKIALDHLHELDDYYTKLNKMENE